tara:strand:+ start:350 stop:586 length:237 start_codon:yes stop_codon:yes gene_type:complete
LALSGLLVEAKLFTDALPFGGQLYRTTSLSQTIRQPEISVLSASVNFESIAAIGTNALVNGREHLSAPEASLGTPELL